MSNPLTEYIKLHGCRVRRGDAMRMLCIIDDRTWQKVLDANPQLRHRLRGERQFKYVTAEIFRLLPASQQASGVRQVWRMNRQLQPMHAHEFIQSAVS